MVIRDGEMTLQIKCLTHKHDDRRSDSQNHGAVCSSSQICNLSTLVGRWEAARRIPRSLLVAGTVAVKTLVQTVKVETSTQGCPLHTTCMTQATHTYLHVHVYSHTTYTTHI